MIMGHSSAKSSPRTPVSRLSPAAHILSTLRHRHWSQSVLVGCSLTMRAYRTGYMRADLVLKLALSPATDCHWAKRRSVHMPRCIEAWYGCGQERETYA